MTQFKYYGTMAASALLMLASCSGDDAMLNGSDGQGKLDLRLDVNASALASKAESRAFADNGVVTADDLAISLTSPDGSYSKEWSSPADLAANPLVGVGDYTLSAHFGSIDAQGFDAPYYFGSTEIRVRENETTTVALTAQLANSMFSVTYSEGLKKLMASYSAELQAAGLEPVEYPADEVRPIYVKPGNVDVYVNIEKHSGVKARLLAATVQAQPRHHYHVNVDVNGGDAGGDAQLVVTFDDTLQAEDYVVDLSDELLNTAAPELTATGFAAGDVLDRIVGVPYEEDLSLSIIARAGLKQVKMTTEGASALGSTWPADIDLIAASAAEQAALKSLGFSAMGLWRNPDKMAVISFAPVLEHIAVAKGADAADVKFSFTAIDKMGKASEPVTLTVHVENESIEISEGSGLFMVGDNSYTLNMNYNGADPAANLVVEMANNRGTWDAVQGVTFTPKSRAMTEYTVTVPVDDASNYKLRVATRSRSAISNEIEAVRYIPDFEVAYVDAFATKAYFTVTEKGGDNDGRDLAPFAKLLLSANGGAFQKVTTAAEDGYLVASGLTDATAYAAKITLTGKEADAADAGSFTTEAATQLPNGDMEAWTKTDGASHWNLYYPWTEAATSPWGTNNPMTTSQGGNYGYVRVSGTEGTSDCHGGSQAAVIRTQGWGSGNTATGQTSGTGWLSSKMKYADAGLLHLGSSRSARPSGYSGVTGTISTDDLDCGIEFTSRPESLSFWYKYEAKNASDKGYAEFWLKDANGNVLASAKKDLDATSSWSQVTFSSKCPVGSAKGAKIYVKFLSTNSESTLVKEDAYITAPKFGATGSEQYVGSKLWIDDITLNY